MSRPNVWRAYSFILTLVMFSLWRSAPPAPSAPSGPSVYGPPAPTAPGRLWRLVRGPIDEIANDGLLRAYGAVLVLTRVLTAAFWWREGIATIINRGAEPICWSLVPNCGPLRILSTGQVEWMLIGYAVVALLIAPLFVSRRLTPAGYVGLIALTLFKVIVLAMDFVSGGISTTWRSGYPELFCSCPRSARRCDYC